MKNPPAMLCLLILLGLNFSCTQTDKITIEEPKPDAPTIEISLNQVNDSLKYTAGICSIFQDSKGQYWFGSYREGVCRYNGKTFTYFTENDGLSNNQVRTIQEDKRGTIWFGTGNGVSSFDGKKITKYLKNDLTKSIGFDTSNNWASTPAALWCSAGRKANAIKIENNQAYHLDYPDSLFKKKPDNAEATGFSKGNKGNIWVASYSSVVGFDGKNFTKIDNESLGYSKEGDFLHVRSILEDSKGNLWIGNNGIGVLLDEGNGITNFSKKLNIYDDGISSNGNRSPTGTLNHVFAITETKNGDIWFGDRDTGAWKYDGESITNFTVDDKLTKQMIWHIYEDKKGNLLFAMANGGVYRFDSESFEQVF